MNPPATLLLRYLRREIDLDGLDHPELDLLLRQARAALLLPRLALEASERGLLPGLPPVARRQLEPALFHAGAQRRALEWELKRLAVPFENAGYPVILLKGAAYHLLGLPLSRGRLFGDIDLLVPKDQLADAERRLLFAGWLPVQMDAYDQRYFRQWMHEVPPLKHIQRGSHIDLHHTIVPPTSRFSCTIGALFDAARPLPGTPFATLAPEDLVLHSATHLYTEGELEHGLRNLSDLDGLLRHYGRDEGYYRALCERANRIGLARPLSHSLRHCHALLGTPIPASLADQLQDRPGQLASWLLDGLYRRSLRPYHPSCTGQMERAADLLLYIRGHYLRMPLHLLIPHLLRKTLRRA